MNTQLPPTGCFRTIQLPSTGWDMKITATLYRVIHDHTATLYRVIQYHRATHCKVIHDRPYIYPLQGDTQGQTRVCTVDV
jgi:hypothetical protein